MHCSETRRTCVYAMMAKTKRLTKKELGLIAKQLKQASIPTILDKVLKEVGKERHLLFFGNRKSLWEYIVTSKRQFLGDILRDGLLKFCSLYEEECATGANRHLRLLMDWNSFCATYAVDSMKTDLSS